MADALTLLCDVAEDRVSAQRLTVTLPDHPLEQGESAWDLPNSSQVFVDAITGVAMLAPLPTTATWQTGGGGSWARLRKTDYSVAASADWVEHRLRHDDDVYLYGLGSHGNDEVSTLGSYAADQPFYLSTFFFGPSNNVFPALKVTLGDSLILYVWNSGRVEVWRGSTYLDEGNVTQLPPDVRVAPQMPGTNLAGGAMDLLIIPYKADRLLVTSSRGGGFALTLTDVDLSLPDPVAYPSAPLRWQVLSGQAMVSAQEMRTLTTGTLLSQIVYLREPPVTGATAEASAWKSTPVGGSVTAEFMEEDGVTPFVGDDVKASGRIRLTLDSDGHSTPFVFAAQAVFDRVLATMPNSDVDLMEWYQPQGRLTVGEHPSDVSWEVAMSDVDDLETAAPLSWVLSNRPVEARIGTVPFLRGVVTEPQVDDDVNQRTSRTSWTLRDWWDRLERETVKDFTAFDGRKIMDVVTDMLTLAGFSAAQLDLEPMDLTLGGVDGAPRGEWKITAEPGTSVADVLLRLWEDYLPDYLMGFVPAPDGPKFRLRDPDGLDATPVQALFVDDPGYIPYEQGVWRWSMRTVPPEANLITVTGGDPYTRRVFQARHREWASQDPTTAIADRPRNYVGAIWDYALVDEAFTSQELCNWSCARLARRLCQERTMAQWEGELVMRSDGCPAWNGDVVSIAGGKEEGLYRIVSFDWTTYVEDGDADNIARPCSYVGERIGDLP